MNLNGRRAPILLNVGHEVDVRDRPLGTQWLAGASTAALGSTALSTRVQSVTSRVSVQFPNVWPTTSRHNPGGYRPTPRSCSAAVGCRSIAAVEPELRVLGQDGRPSEGLVEGTTRRVQTEDADQTTIRGSRVGMSEVRPTEGHGPADVRLYTVASTSNACSTNSPIRSRSSADTVRMN